MAPRIILGNRAGVEGLWISRPGKTALSTNPNDFLVDTSKESSWPFMKGSLNSVPYAGESPQFLGTGTLPRHYYATTISHNLGYVPLMWTMQNLDGTPNPTSYLSQFPASVDVYLTTSSLVIECYQPYSTQPAQPVATIGYTLYYVIFQNRLGA